MASEEELPDAAEAPWYATLREQWRPEVVRLLLIGESAPDDRGDPSRRRFFYADHLTGNDNLFRAVVHALYDVPHLDSRTTNKRDWLAHLQRDGVYLIDLVPYPVNGAAMQQSRARARRENVTGCVERAAALEPAGVLVCHGPSFAVLNTPLREAGLPVLHDDPIPFPLGNWRSEFVARVREAVSRQSRS